MAPLFDFGNLMSKSDSKFRYVILVLQAVIFVCIWYSFGIPSAMISALQGYMGDDDATFSKSTTLPLDEL